MNSEYIQSTLRGKLYFAVAIALAVAIVVFMSTYKPGEDVQAKSNIELKVAVEEIRQDILIMLIVAVCFQPITWISAFKIFNQGKKVKELGRYPLPNANLPFKTKIQTGEKAMMQAVSLKIFAFFILFIGLFILGLGIWGYMNIGNIVIYD